MDGQTIAVVTALSEIIKALGGLGALVFAVVLFVKGEIVSRATADRMIKPYEDQAKLLGNSFGDKLEAVGKSMADSNDRLSGVVKEYLEEGRASRAEMQKVVRDLMVAVAEIPKNPGKSRAKR